MNSFNFNPVFVEQLKQKNILTATNVQKTVIPIILQGKNIIFQSDTGTGKTLAFLLPLIERHKLMTSENIVLIVSPTHELASQIKNEANYFEGIKSILCFGGVPIKRQIEMLKTKPQVIVGSATRLSELIMLKKIKIQNVSAIVFDEVDRLLSKELREKSLQLLSLVYQNTNIQIIACSATIKNDTEISLNKTFNKKDNISLFEIIKLPSENILTNKIKHIAIYAENCNKADTLRSFLAAVQPKKTLVFTSRPQDAEILASKLRNKKVNCECLHAKADKIKRKSAIDKFRSGKSNLLITSDLAARGLDIANISHIIQMDLPKAEDFFIHRTGRTARCGKEGINVVIGDAFEMENFARLEKKLKIFVNPAELHGGKLVFLK